MTEVLAAAAGGYFLGLATAVGVAAIVAAVVWKDIRG